MQHAMLHIMQHTMLYMHPCMQTTTIPCSTHAAHPPYQFVCRGFKLGELVLQRICSEVCHVCAQICCINKIRGTRCNLFFRLAKLPFCVVQLPVQMSVYDYEHVHIYADAHFDIGIYPHVCAHVYAHDCAKVCAHVRMHVCPHVYTHVHTSLWHRARLEALPGSASRLLPQAAHLPGAVCV